MERDFTNIASFRGQNITVSPAAYALIDGRREEAKARGIIISRRELADKAILAVYGNGGEG